MQSLSEFLLHTMDPRFPYASTVGGPCRNKMQRDTMSLQVFFYSMIASDCIMAWGEVNIILSACMIENARAA